jgi:hypothetical protein
VNDAALSAMLADLLDAYPRAKIGHATIAVYRKHLADLEGDVAGAVAEIIRTSEFFPTVAEIRATVARRTLGLPAPEEALQAAINGDQLTGLAHEVVMVLGGRSAFRTTDKPAVWRSQFLSLYTARAAKMTRELQVGTTKSEEPTEIIEAWPQRREIG